MAWSLRQLALAAAHLLLATRIVSAYPGTLQGLAERQVDVDELRESYDYIIVGGGQSGLVIAERLSENPNNTVLIVEYGHLENDPSILLPSPQPYPPRAMFNVTSAPQVELDGRTTAVFAASVVGGGSTINGMFLDRGSAEDYDNWESLGNQGWGWSGLLPYFKKSTMLSPPVPELEEEFGITYDIDAAYGRDSPIHVSYPPWQYPGQKIQWDAWLELGIEPSIEGAAGDAHGIFWIPSAQDPANQTRSYARNEYYDPAASRPNLHLLTGYRVNEVLLSQHKRAESIVMQKRDTPEGSDGVNVKAQEEIVLSAGWLHTPQILQRSGIGPRALLEEAGVDVLVDLPGVGANLQDHPATNIAYEFTSDIFPNPTSMRTNETFAAWAQEVWDKNRTGPLSMGVGNSAAFLPFPDFDENYEDLIEQVKAQDAKEYLPEAYDQAMVEGFEMQRDVLMKSFASRENALLEFPFSGGAGGSVVFQKPLSRGTVTLNTTDLYAAPVVDYHVLMNPADLDIFVPMINYIRKWYATPTMEQFGPVEISPGANVTSDEELKQASRAGMTASIAHSCCTSSMMPEELGGVVGPDLLVHGVKGLSVADGSIMPLIPATHLCATQYAIAEKAADIIKQRR